MADINKFIMGVVIVGITLVIAIFIASTIQNATDETTSISVVNETGSWLNATTYTVDNFGASDFAGLTINSAINVTDNSSIGTGNFTVSGTGFTNATATTWDSIWVSYSYTYSAATDTSSASAELVTAFSGGSSWIAILIVVMFATIILGMLTNGLGRSAQVESAYDY